MDINTLKEFITLADRLNFSETAKLHYITQPVLSKHIQQLEETLGVKLFYRSRQAVELTKYGELFLEDAQVIVSTYESAVSKITRAANVMTSVFSIAFLDGACKEFFPSTISRFMKDYPSVSLQLQSTDIPETYQMLESRECDMALTFKPLIGSYQDCNEFFIYRDPLCVFLPDTHLLSDRESLNFNDLKEERLITATPNLASEYNLFLERLLKKNGILIREKRATNTLGEGFTLVESGIGITIAPKHQKFFTSSHVKCIPLDSDECFIDVVVLWKKNNSNPNIQRMVDIIWEQTESMR